jgi:hypothetical protein
MCFSSLSIAYATEEELDEAMSFAGVAPAAVCERDINDEPSDVMLRRAFDECTADNLLKRLSWEKAFKYNARFGGVDEAIRSGGSWKQNARSGVCKVVAPPNDLVQPATSEVTPKIRVPQTTKLC